jgi:predicted transcriptional regulator
MYNETENNKNVMQDAVDVGTKAEKNILFFLTPKESVAFLQDHYTLQKGLEKLRLHGYTAMPVVTKDGSYASTVSEGDFLWHILDNNIYDIRLQEEYLISDIIQKGWNPAVKISTCLEDVLLCVMEQNFVAVIDDREKFMGIITRRDIIRYFIYSKIK